MTQLSIWFDCNIYYIKSRLLCLKRSKKRRQTYFYFNCPINVSDFSVDYDFIKEWLNELYGLLNDTNILIIVPY